MTHPDTIVRMSESIARSHLRDVKEAQRLLALARARCVELHSEAFADLLYGPEVVK